MRGPQAHAIWREFRWRNKSDHITHQPNLSEEQVTAKVIASGTEGGGCNGEVDGLINQPIVSGVLAVRAVVFDRNYSGYIDQYPTNPNNYLAVLPGPVDKDINSEQTPLADASPSRRSPPASFPPLSRRIINKIRTWGAPFTFDALPGSFSRPRSPKPPGSRAIHRPNAVVHADAAR